MTGLETLDWVVIGAYFAILAGVAVWASRNQDTSKDYFLAGRNIGWFVIGASLFATNIGSEHIVGLAGSGFQDGVAMAHYELHAWCLLVLGWLFVPFYMRSGVYTMPEFLERRYSPAARWILSVISLVAYVFTKVSVTVYAGGKVFQTLFPEASMLGMDAFWVGAFSTVILTGLYTVTGGLRAVVFTDTMQTVVLVIGSLAVTTFGLIKIGGWSNVRAAVGSEHLNLWKPANHPDFPWVGMLFCAPIVGLWYWCTDQYIVQRTLAARNMTQARRGTIWGAYLKLLPVWLFIVPGLIAYALYLNGQLEMPPLKIGGQIVLDAAGKIVPDRDATFAAMVQALLPIGIRGLVVAGLLAALMSSLSSLFNSTSTLFTIDVYKKLHPQASEKTLVRVGRIATACVVALGIAWIPVMQRVGGGLYLYLQAVQAYLAPPITAVFFLGVFYKRINSQGAIAGLVCGFILGMLKLGAWVWTASSPDTAPSLVWTFHNFNFLYFALVLFGVSVVIVVVASLFSPPPQDEQIRGLTYATTAGEHKAETRASWNKWDVINTLIILATITAVYVYFSG
ncbi:MAG: Sodium/glucose cotransporter [Planctomycetes bacterium ADurb.Bin126]|nr:MAG: Sodium/glucose cotransporter [Planctomycetes bacterium ADurb.Bin126]HOD84478.1 sodium:solute symporter [Phycisphaerae bacterium]HQL72968.1 sodium:solute symporter [Phycisphaerae bacterium]